MTGSLVRLCRDMNMRGHGRYGLCVVFLQMHAEARSPRQLGVVMGWVMLRLPLLATVT